MPETPQKSGPPKDMGRRRVVIEAVSPEIDCGRFPAKRCVGDVVAIEADVFTDGHDAVAARLQYREKGETSWRATPMELLDNDRWRGTFTADQLGRWEYTVVGWVDHWTTWRRDMEKRIRARVDVPVNLLVGARHVRDAADRVRARGGEEKPPGEAGRSDAARLDRLADVLEDESVDALERARRALSDEVDRIMRRYPDTRFGISYPRILELEVDPELARFSAWYELFPRSAGEAGEHGTFRDVEDRLDYVSRMGFDVLYLPPIHPIGRTHRKGKNNVRSALRGDVGSPWAIGAEEGGHKAIHPELGTLAEFRSLVKRARDEYGIEVALDIAFQVSPDHPYAREHPEWFRKRPDGTIQHAENPPKKYEDIYPLDFETAAWESLWSELKSVFEFWVEQGVTLFRVDNPHTKAFPFWEWCITELKREHPELIFLSEAFTRPKVMYRLAKAGFTQSYTYFAWRYTKQDIAQYATELTRPPVVDFFRPSFWPNTPDILTEQLQTGSRAVYLARLVLAATLSSSYGIYGPAFELMESRPREEGGEEYLDSEKYQVREWDLDRSDSLAEFIGRVNAIRAANPALHWNRTLRMVDIDNEHLLAYAKTDPTGQNILLVIVNLDPYHTQSGLVDVPIHDWGIEPDETYTVHDLLGEAHYQWQGWRNYVELNPFAVPAHIFRVQRKPRSEKDFDTYYM